MITLALLIANTVASIYAWNNEDIMNKWIFNPYKIYHNRQYYRFITSAFIHADWIHLIFNLITLYSFGRALEYYYMYFKGEEGMIFYIMIYLLAIPVSKLVTYYKYKEKSGFNSLGASGAVSAVLFSCIVLNPFGGIGFLFLPFDVPGFIFGAIYLIYSHYYSSRNVDNVNHDAHLYGALFGIVFTAIVFPFSIPSFWAQLSQWSLF
ncbi:MAG: rhomboid family intramembrane serine protease [Cytophagaceae bacterium]|nr:rhomboid family intramembrane serine protease [Cytophagaceae bacterium]MDW8456836.1 rhomboid family intramembrane serine protease [Cytophagaceae bacterium]